MNHKKSMNSDAVSRKKRKGVRTAFLVISLAIISAIGFFIMPLFTSGAPQREIIVVPDDGSMRSLSDSLSVRFGKGYATRTIRAARLMLGAFHLRPGAYEIRKGDSPFTAARRLGRGRQLIVTLALNNIRTIDEFAEKTSGMLKATPQEILQAISDKATLAAYGLTPESAMALVVADNYELYWNSDPETIIRKLGDRFESLWDDNRKKRAADLGLTPLEVETIASIADEETSKSDEKGRVCRLYYNRLMKGMRLQADPTVKFAIGDFGIKRILKSHLNAESPYNTYRVEGLPPGPIRITDPATVDAFLNSSPTDEIYMCARSDLSGYHDFTASYSEHLSNARRYQEKLNQLGI